MNKSDVIDRVASATDVPRAKAEAVIDALFDTIKTAAGDGEKVAWPGFGAFSVADRKARTGRNPRTGEAVEIAASKALKFTPGVALKDFMNKK